MQFTFVNYCYLLVFLLLQYVYALDPIALGAISFGALSSFGYTSFIYLKCTFVECCEEPWVRSANFSHILRTGLESRVYGQHIALQLILDNMKNHLSHPAKKPLVMSFHGGTGVGKNYVTRILAEAMFKKGLRSKYYHLIITTMMFPYANEVPQYRASLHQWIIGNLTRCSRSLFIFDEVDKMPAGVLDGLAPFIDYHDQHIGGADPRQAVFVFISNTGRQHIDVTTYESFEAGIPRESLSILNFQKGIQGRAFNDMANKGLYRSDLIQQELVDIYVPFLPLEKKHVQSCLRDYLKEGNYTIDEKVVELISEDLDYFPPDRPMFSTSGCKRIREKVVGRKSLLKKLPLASKARNGQKH